jgi:hypothetical protein
MTATSLTLGVTFFEFMEARYGVTPRLTASVEVPPNFEHPIVRNRTCVSSYRERLRLWTVQCHPESPGLVPRQGAPVASLLPQRGEKPQRQGLSGLDGEGGIRTPDGLKAHTGFRDRRIQPLCHLSRWGG